MSVKQANAAERQEQADLIARKESVIELSNGKVFRMPYVRPFAQDKIDILNVKQERLKEKYQDDVVKLNAETRRYGAKCVAALLMKTYFGLRLFWWIRWRWIYYHTKLDNEDYLKISLEAKKKAQEQEYSLAMALMMDMTTMMTNLAKKEVEQFHQELELVRKAQSLKNSQS